MIEELDVLSAGYPGNLEVLHKGPKRSLCKFYHFLKLILSIFLSPTILVLIPIQIHQLIWIHIRFGSATLLSLCNRRKQLVR
jgi:hypothetical protein